MKKSILKCNLILTALLSVSLFSCTHNGTNSSEENSSSSMRSYSIAYFDGESENLFSESTGDGFTTLYTNPCTSFSNVANKEFSGSEYSVDFVKTDDGCCYIRFNDSSSSDAKDWVSYWYLFIGQQKDTCFFVPVREEGKSYPKSGCITGLKIISDSRIRLTVYGKDVDFKTGNSDGGKSVPNNPTVRGLYLANLQGKRNLSNGNEFEISSKINVQASDTKYWFAHAVGYQFTSDGSYSILLCHDSNTDPGITGKEPFISRQGVFWSRMNIRPSENEWTVSWSSSWSELPHEAFKLSCDMSETCKADPIEKNTYEYIFLYGRPNLNGGFYETEKGKEIARYSLETYEQKTFTLEELLGLAQIDSSKIEIPEGKEIVGWWYSTGSITGILESYRYALKNDSEINYAKKEIYLELKDSEKSGEPTGNESGFVPSGTYEASGSIWEGYSLTVNGKNATLNYPGGSKDFEIIPDFEANKDFQDFGGDYPNIRIFYSLTKIYRIKIYESSSSGTKVLEWNK